MGEIYTLYTRSNFDGLVSSALLKTLGLVDKIAFVHPKDFQDGKIEVEPNSISACLSYKDGIYMAFDHHSSEEIKESEIKNNFIFEPAAPSCARIIYEYFGADYDAWYDRMLETYTRYNEELGHVFSQRMTAHEYEQANLACTMYEDGTRVYVNYSYSDMTAKDGTLVPARDYAVVR